jgi:hypothetical protein
LIRGQAHWRCGSFDAGVEMGGGVVPVGAGEFADAPAGNAEEVALGGDAKSAAAGALCDVVGKDAALGASADEVIALSGFSK